MNKNYTKALINEMFDQKILNSEDDRARIKELIAFVDGDFTGSFEDDLEILKEVWKEDQEDEEIVEEEVSPTEKIVNSLKIGFNYIPGIGVGYCSSEEDLEAMKNFVRGGMIIHEMYEHLLGI